MKGKTTALKSGCTGIPLLGELWVWMRGSFVLLVCLLFLFLFCFREIQVVIALPRAEEDKYSH